MFYKTFVKKNVFHKQGRPMEFEIITTLMFRIDYYMWFPISAFFSYTFSRLKKRFFWFIYNNFWPSWASRFIPKCDFCLKEPRIWAFQQIPLFYIKIVLQQIFNLKWLHNLKLTLQKKCMYQRCSELIGIPKNVSQASFTVRNFFKIP